MNNVNEFFVVGCLIALAIVVQIFISRRRHKRNLREYLEPTLKKCDVEFVSAIYPGMFKVGPFPKFEIETGRPQSNVNGTRGEYNEYRIVSFKDSKGRTYQVWALVEFELLRFRRVRWRAEQKNLLPETVLNILEN